MVTNPTTRPLKYGENPQQKAMVVLDARSRDPLAIGKFQTISGAPSTHAPRPSVNETALHFLAEENGM